MSDFLDLLTEAVGYLSDLTALLNALHDVGLDEFDVHVHATVLPPDASTATAQATQLTALQKIDDLQDALESVDTDALQVRGRDQLFSLAGVLARTRFGTILGADDESHSAPVPAGAYWIVTNIAARTVESATTEHRYVLLHDGSEFPLGKTTAAIAANELSYWQGSVWLDPDDRIYVYFIGAANLDTAYVTITGFIMTLET